MKDDPTAVEVRVMCGGAALVEYGRKGWTGNHSAYIESKAGESFCLDLQYHGGSLLGFYAAIGVDGVHIEGYTLVPSISESCLGKLSADDFGSNQFLGPQVRASQRFVPSFSSDPVLDTAQPTPSKDQLEKDSKLGSIEVKLYRVTGRCENCPSEGTREASPEPEYLLLPSDVVPELSEQSLLDPPEPFTAAAVSDGKEFGYDWEAKPSATFLFKYRSAASLQRLKINTNARKSHARDSPIVPAQPFRSTRSRQVDANEGAESHGGRASPPPQRTPSPRPDPIPERSLHDRTPSAAPAPAPATRQISNPRWQAAPPPPSAHSRRTTPVASGSGLAPADRPRAITPAAPAPQVVPPRQNARLMNGSRSVPKPFAPPRVPTPEHSASRPPRLDPSPNEQEHSPIPAPETPQTLRHNRTASVVEQNGPAQSPAVESANALHQRQAQRILDFNDEKVKRVDQLQKLRDEEEQMRAKLRKLSEDIFIAERVQATEAVEEETLQMQELMAREEVKAVLEKEKKAALESAVKAEADTKRGPADWAAVVEWAKRVKVEPKKYDIEID